LLFGEVAERLKALPC